MIQIGRNMLWYKDYKKEVEFSKLHGFDFMQIWFKNGIIPIDNMPEPRGKYIKDIGFPVIIHALFKIDDFEKYGDRLLELVSYFQDNEVIIHPICRSSEIGKRSASELLEQVNIFSQKAEKQGITFYLENNSVIDGINYKKEDLQVIYNSNTYVEQLLDVAHIDNYKHLEEIISVKYPKCLHVAGKHFNVPHEHLPITQGDIDYKLVFQSYLKNYDGKIILEVEGTDEEIVASKKIIDEAIRSVL